MGIVARQSFYNVLSVIVAIGIGAINTIVFYPRFMGEALYGIILILLAESKILQPIFSFGLQHTVIKYFSAQESKKERDKLLLFSLLIPFFVILPSAFLFFGYYDSISNYLATENELIASYAFLIFVIAVSTAYFEIFYSWSRVQKQTTFGNFLKEVYQRILIALLLLAYAVGWLDYSGFIYALIVGYYLRLVLIMGYSLWLYCPSFYWELPQQTKELFRYSLLIFLSAFGASVIIDIDASMLGKMVEDKYIAYYKVAVFIAATIEAPRRALIQIVSPLVAEALNTNNREELKALLQKSGTNLLLVAGLFFVLINANTNDLYAFIYFLNGKEGFALAIPVVLLISITKLSTASTGCLDNIITNSRYYYLVPFLSIGSAIAVVLFNFYFIEQFGFTGAALATLLVILLFNGIKLALVQWTFNISPYGRKTVYLLLIIGMTYVLFSTLVLPFAPLLNLIIKGGLIALVYLGVCYSLRLSDTVNQFLENFFKKLRSIPFS